MRLNITVRRDGHEVVTRQFAICDSLLSVAGETLKGCEGVSPSNFRIRLQAFRAPTDNDRSFGNWLAKDWKRCGLDTLTIPMTTERQGNELTFTFEIPDTLPPLPRLGIVIELPRDYELLTWKGRGPWDNYPDRKFSCPVGLWQSTVSKQYVHYPRPQDSGNHEDCTYVELRTKKGKKLCIEAIDLNPLEADMAVGAGKLQIAVWAVWPQVASSVLSYTFYAFELNVRASTVLGYVGAGGIGVKLNEALGLFRYERVSIIILFIFVVVVAVDSVSEAIRRRLK